MAAKNITGLGLVTALVGGAVLQASGPDYNKIVIEADPENASTEYILVYDADVILLAKLAPGNGLTIGDESYGDVLDPSRLTLKSTSGAGKYTGFLYQR